MNKFGLPNLGFGLGLRSKHYPYIFENKPQIDWFEVISENYMDSKGKARENLEKVRVDYPIILHGVSMSIGSSDPLNIQYLERLKNLIDEVEPAWVSDHLCWTGINHKNTHDLLPVPLTEEALDHVVGRIQKVQDFLGRRILLENPSSYLTFKADSIPEYEFMSEMAKRADCGLLLDVNNVYVASFNHRLDPKKYIDAIPMERVVQIHLAGHENNETHIIDTHDGHVINEVWDLYKYAIQKAGYVPSTMVEWDSKIPDFPVLEAEINKAKEFAGQTIELKPKEEFKFEGQGKSNHSVLQLQENLQNTILSGDLKSQEPETWIVEKPNFPPESQLNVYVRGYRLRLYDIIMSDYEVTRHCLGDSMKALVQEFIETTPSTFYNVDFYAAEFSGWLAKKDVDEFAKEMANLEKVISATFIMPHSDPLEPQDLANTNPEDFMELYLKPRHAATLLQCKNNINEYMSSFYEDEKTATKNEDDKNHYLIIYRNNNKVFRLELEQDEFHLLQQLELGKNIGEAMEICAEKSAFNEEELSTKIQTWFSRWVSNGILQKPKKIKTKAA